MRHLLWMTATALGLIVLGAYAWGHDATHSPEDSDPAMADWFRSLAIPHPEEGGVEYPGSCCNDKDCHALKDDQWRVVDDHYEVIDLDDTAHERWLRVDPDRILHRTDNPTGKTVACVAYHRVICFLAGFRT